MRRIQNLCSETLNARICNFKKVITPIACFVLLSAFSSQALSDGWWEGTAAPNTNTIASTRHNLTMNYVNGPDISGAMDPYRNDYIEVCVYCHTPHGANSQVDAPLWNRTINTSQYQIYDKPRTLNRPIGQPGPNSLTCLSCHDGTISIDSIINMPGSGGYDPSREAAWLPASLDVWNNDAGDANNHARLTQPENAGDPFNTCLRCHSNDGLVSGISFDVFEIGTDLRDDHPIGIQYPEGPYGKEIGVDFAEPYKQFSNSTGVPMWFHDTNGNTYPDKDEPRMYNTGENFEVECASCHDPHGVPISGPGSEFIPSFLRVSNGNANTGEGNPSGLCLTCHVK